MTDTTSDDFPNGLTGSPSKIYDDTDGNGVTTEVRGQIETAGDQDWIPFNMRASLTYIIYLRGTSENQIGLDRIKKLDYPELMGLYDASGSLLTNTSIQYADGYAFYKYKIPESGTYYVAVSSLNDDTGFYRLQFEPDSAIDDYSNFTTTTARVMVGRDFSGEIGGSSDQDWVAVTLKAGTSYQFDLEGTDTSAGTLTQPDLAGIYDANGVAVTGFEKLENDSSGAGKTSIIKYTPSESGTFYIAAAGTGTDLFNTGTYKLSAKNSGDDYGTTIPTAGTLSIDGSVSAEIELAEDQDWFAVTLEAGTEYQFDLEGSATDAGTLSDPAISGGYGPDGSLIENSFNDDGGTGSNSQLTYTPTISGTYYLAASGIGGSTGTYKVSAKNLTAIDDYENSISTTGSVSVNGSISATIGQSQDEDWFAVALHAGARYTFDLEGLDSNAGTLVDPFLAGVYDSSGVLIVDTTAYDDSGTGSNSKLYYTPKSSGTYYIAAKAIGALKGTYKLSVSDLFATQYTLLEDKPLILNPSIPTEKIVGTVISSSTNTIEVLETVTGNKYTVKIEGTFNEITTGSLDDIQGTVNSITFYDTALQEVESLRYQTSFSGGRDAKNVINNWRGRQQTDVTTTTDPLTGLISESTTDPTTGVVTTTDLATGTVTTTDSAGNVTAVATTDQTTGIITKTDAATGIVTTSNPTTGVVTTTNSTGSVIAVATTDPTSGVVTTTDVTTGIVTMSAPEVTSVPLNFLVNGSLITSSTGNNNDVVDAGDGRDLIMLNRGDDTLNGGGGADTSVYSGSRADYNVTKDLESGGYIVSDSLASRDGTDSLTNVEHLFFNDGYLALEDDTNIVRDTARILGTLYGAQYVGASDSDFNGEIAAGQIIYYQRVLGGFEITMQVLLSSKLGESPSSIDVVNMLFENLAGLTPTIEQAQPFVDQLDNGTYSAIELVLAAATDPFTDNAVGLVGIVDAGLPYLLPNGFVLI